MSNRPTIVGQADVARVIRACKQAGLTVARVVVKGDRVEIEAGGDSGEVRVIPVERRKEVVL